MCGGFGKLKHFQVLCKSKDDRWCAVHETEQNVVAHKQNDMVSIKSLLSIVHIQ